MSTRAQQLRTLGQSVWLDFIRRGLLDSGEFDRLVQEQGVVGVTSNPTIFEQAVSKSHDYDTTLERGIAEGADARGLLDRLMFEDIRSACDHLRPTFEATGGLDGRVSIEVSPKLAYDTRATIEEARRLHRAVSKTNLMVKVPATEAGLPAITQLTAEGVCVNVTLTFSLERYAQVMEAYLKGLEERLAAGQPVDQIFSVASFFVSRVDTTIDKGIEAAAAKLPPGDARRRELESLAGKAAVANARLAYQRFKRFFAEPRFSGPSARGAHVQRPLWASTSTKNPAYPDTMYVDELIGPDTVNTMPPQTLEAFNDHGTVALTVERDLDGARRLFERLRELGIDPDGRIAALEREGVDSFAKSYDSLSHALEQRHREMAGRR